MEVLSLPESSSIHPLNLPHRSFLLLRLGVLHLCCCMSGFLWQWTRGGCRPWHSWSGCRRPRRDQTRRLHWARCCSSRRRRPVPLFLQHMFCYGCSWPRRHRPGCHRPGHCCPGRHRSSWWPGRWWPRFVSMLLQFLVLACEWFDVSKVVHVARKFMCAYMVLKQGSSTLLQFLAYARLNVW
jgi:hypothetical protein